MPNKNLLLTTSDWYGRPGNTKTLALYPLFSITGNVGPLELGICVTAENWLVCATAKQDIKTAIQLSTSLHWPSITRM